MLLKIRFLLVYNIFLKEFNSALLLIDVQILSKDLLFSTRIDTFYSDNKDFKALGQSDMKKYLFLYLDDLNIQIFACILLAKIVTAFLTFKVVLKITQGDANFH